MRRRLVLTNETARHPFRARMVPLRQPPLSGYNRGLRTVAGRLADLRDFLLSFCAFFLAALAFIA